MVDSYLQCSAACAHVPDLRIRWLLLLGEAHQELDAGGVAEAAQCAVAAAGVAMQYLAGFQETGRTPGSAATGDAEERSPRSSPGDGGGGQGAQAPTQGLSQLTEARLAWGWEAAQVEALRRLCPELPEVSAGLLRAARAQASLKPLRQGEQQGPQGSPAASEHSAASSRAPYEQQRLEARASSSMGAPAAPLESPRGPSSVGSSLGVVEATGGTSSLGDGGGSTAGTAAGALPGGAPAVALFGRVAGYLHITERLAVSLLHQASKLFARAALHLFAAQVSSIPSGPCVCPGPRRGLAPPASGTCCSRGAHEGRLEIVVVCRQAAGEGSYGHAHGAAVQVVEVLMVLCQRRKSSHGIIRCHAELGSYYGALARPRPQPPYGEALPPPGLPGDGISPAPQASFFLIAFYGERFGPGVNGVEFVYKEPR